MPGASGGVGLGLLDGAGNPVNIAGDPNNAAPPGVVAGRGGDAWRCSKEEMSGGETPIRDCL